MSFIPLNYYRIKDVSIKLSILNYSPIDVLLIGSTGSGKSSTLNSIFCNEVSKIGFGVNPETLYIKDYLLENGIRFWDTPGLGDSILNDKIYYEKIFEVLKWKIKYDDKYAFIDMVVIILDASIRDMGTSFNIINKILTILKESHRLVIGLNQADFAMKSNNFNKEINEPSLELKNFLQEKKISIQKRIKESIGLDNINIIEYSALTGYNIDKFLDLIIDNIPKNKRKI